MVLEILIYFMPWGGASVVLLLFGEGSKFKVEGCPSASLRMRL
jgi:hypothetical protein